MKNEESSEQESARLEELEEKKDKDGSKRKEYGQLSQRRSAILSAVIIIFVLDLIGLLYQH